MFGYIFLRLTATHIIFSQFYLYHQNDGFKSAALGVGNDKHLLYKLSNFFGCVSSSNLFLVLLSNKT